ncbi:15030_t:CDS:1, partial [Rhizophagus irregularis]
KGQYYYKLLTASVTITRDGKFNNSSFRKNGIELIEPPTTSNP